MRQSEFIKKCHKEYVKAEKELTPAEDGELAAKEEYEEIDDECSYNLDVIEDNIRFLKDNMSDEEYEYIRIYISDLL